MAMERTLSIIKPDATRRNLTGKINARLEKAGLRIVAQKRLRLSLEQAEKFYAVHKARPFFESLCSLHDLAGRWWSRCWRARTRWRGTAR